MSYRLMLTLAFRLLVYHQRIGSFKQMKLRWVSGDEKPQQVQYGGGKSATSNVTTFTKDDMCTSVLASPAKDFGWHDPGFIHTAVMTGLQPSQNYTYKYGSNSVGWSNQITFKTPPASGSDKLQFLACGDMGKAPLDQSAEHYIQPGSLSVIDALKKEVAAGNYDSIFHIGDISYATGFLVEWDFFLSLITPLAGLMPYMTAIGNHERDYGGSGSVYITPDSGGECGVAYETYFPIPTAGKDKPWYSIEQANVHFTVISTENDWFENSEQYEWIKMDLSSVNRERTRWVIFMGHRPMYTHGDLLSADPIFKANIEPLLMDYKSGCTVCDVGVVDVCFPGIFGCVFVLCIYEGSFLYLTNVCGYYGSMTCCILVEYVVERIVE